MLPCFGSAVNRKLLTVNCFPVWIELVPLATIVKVFEAFAGGMLASNSLTVNSHLPPVAGAPEITPVALFSESPGSRLPEDIVQLYGIFPPLACK